MYICGHLLLKGGRTTCPVAELRLGYIGSGELFKGEKVFAEELAETGNFIEAGKAPFGEDGKIVHPPVKPELMLVFLDFLQFAYGIGCAVYRVASCMNFPLLKAFEFFKTCKNQWCNAYSANGK